MFLSSNSRGGGGAPHPSPHEDAMPLTPSPLGARMTPTLSHHLYITLGYEYPCVINNLHFGSTHCQTGRMDSNQFHYVPENPWPKKKNIEGKE